MGGGSFSSAFVSYDSSENPFITKRTSTGATSWTKFMPSYKNRVRALTYKNDQNSIYASFDYPDNSENSILISVSAYDGSIIYTYYIPIVANFNSNGFSEYTG